MWSLVSSATSQSRFTLPEVPAPVPEGRELHVRGGFTIRLPNDWMYSLERRDRQVMQFGTGDDGEGFQMWFTIRVYEEQEVGADTVDAPTLPLKLYKRYQMDAAEATTWSDSEGYDITLPGRLVEGLNAMEGIYSKSLKLDPQANRIKRAYQFIALRPRNIPVIVALIGVIVVSEKNVVKNEEVGERIQRMERVGFSFRFE